MQKYVSIICPKKGTVTTVLWVFLYKESLTKLSVLHIQESTLCETYWIMYIGSESSPEQRGWAEQPREKGVGEEWPCKEVSKLVMSEFENLEKKTQKTEHWEWKLKLLKLPSRTTSTHAYLMIRHFGIIIFTLFICLKSRTSIISPL